MKRANLTASFTAGFLAALTVSTIAAEMPTRVAKAPMSVAVPVFNWTGFYVGGTAGWGWSKGHHYDGGTNSPGFDLDGFVVGGTIGYNWQWSNWVVGIEADLSHSEIKGSTEAIVPLWCDGNCSNRLNWFGTARVRIGPTFDRVFPYVTGGIAYGKQFADVGDPVQIAGSERMSGWTAGAGVEYAFAPNWSAKFEYLHIDLGGFIYDKASLCGGTPCSVVGGRYDIVRAGLNYRFATGKAPVGPVVTKY